MQHSLDNTLSFDQRCLLTNAKQVLEELQGKHKRPEFDAAIEAIEEIQTEPYVGPW